jgi:hypothetical protein
MACLGVSVGLGAQSIGVSRREPLKMGYRKIRPSANGHIGTHERLARRGQEPSFPELRLNFVPIGHKTVNNSPICCPWHKRA